MSARATGFGGFCTLPGMASGTGTACVSEAGAPTCDALPREHLGRLMKEMHDHVPDEPLDSRLAVLMRKLR